MAKRGKEKKARGQYGPDGTPQLASDRVHKKRPGKEEVKTGQTETIQPSMTTTSIC